MLHVSTVSDTDLHIYTVICISLSSYIHSEQLKSVFNIMCGTDQELMNNKKITRSKLENRVDETTKCKIFLVKIF